MTTFSVIPGTLNIRLKKGDRFSTVVDFDIALTGYTVASEVYSLVSGATVQAITASVINESSGQVQLGLSSSEVALLPAGTYRWKLRWDQGAGAYRTALEGFFEVLA